MKILLGVTGGIAAYKACDLIRLLVKKGAQVTCVMTEEAKQFITPLTLRTLSCNPVYDDLFFEAKNPGAPVVHIDLARNCDAVLIMPATANIIGKIASGIADDLLTTIVMATDKKVIFAPAMNAQMWKNPIVKENIKKLEKHGCKFAGPKSGELACGEYGAGHIEDIEKIAEAVLSPSKKKG